MLNKFDGMGFSSLLNDRFREMRFMRLLIDFGMFFVSLLFVRDRNFKFDKLFSVVGMFLLIIVVVRFSICRVLRFVNELGIGCWSGKFDVLSFCKLGKFWMMLR